MFKLKAIIKTAEKQVLSHKKYLFATAINLTILFVISLMVQVSGLFEIHRFINLQLFAWTVIVLDTIALKVHKKTKSALNSFFKYGFLILIIVQVINVYVPISINLFALTIFFGIVTLFDNRRIIKEYEREEHQDILDEDKRKKEFADKFPGINKIPIVRTIIKWMYKEGWGYSTLLIFFILIGAILRITNLDYFSIYHDETFYTSSTKTYIETGGTNLWNYVTNAPSGRPYNPLITIFLGTFTKLFGYNTFNLRLPEAIFGTLAIFVIYYVTKKIIANKKIAIIASVFLCFNEILIYLSRFIRQYAYFIVICLILALIMHKLNINVRNLKSKKTILFYALSAFAIFVITFVYISPLVVALAIPFLLCLIIHLELSNYRHKVMLLTIFSLSATIIFLIDFLDFYHFIGIKHILTHNVEYVFSQKLIDRYITDIFGSYKLSKTFMFNFAIFSSMLLIYKKKLNGLFLVSLFWIPLYSLSFISHGDDFRYVSFILPFSFVILGTGFYYVLSYPLKILNIKKAHALIIILTLLLFVISPSFPGLNAEPIMHKAQADWTDNDGKVIHRRCVAQEYDKAFSFINQNVKSGDIVIIHDGVHYIQSHPNVTYYELPRYKTTLRNMRSGITIDFFDLMNKEGERIWITGSYMHLVNEKVVDYALKNCHNEAEILGIKYYRYNSYYKNKKLYWPNVFVCEKDIVLE